VDRAEGFAELFAPFLKPDTQLILAQRNAIRTEHLMVNNRRVTKSENLSPGLYCENGDGSPPTTNALHTDAAGFAGISRRGSLEMAAGLTHGNSSRPIVAALFLLVTCPT
jgi:hypothetical protein